MAETREILRVTDDLAREQFTIMLAAINFRAKREVPKVGNDEHPTTCGRSADGRARGHDHRQGGPSPASCPATTSSTT